MKQFFYWSFQGSSSVAGDNSLCVCNFTCSVCGVIIFFLISPYFGSSWGGGGGGSGGALFRDCCISWVSSLIF